MKFKMNKHDKNDNEESLLSVFLSTSQSIDEDINKAKEIIEQEGLDPQKLQKEGMAFITALQVKAKTQNQLSLSDLIKKLITAGIPKTLLEKRIIPSALAIDWRRESYTSESGFIAAFASSIFGLTENDIWEGRKLTFANSPAGTAMFKVPVNASISQIKAYSYYAYYLAKLVAKSYKPVKTEPLPEDIDEFKANYLSKYRSFDLRSLLNYAWELGFCVLPLNDPGVFHGACWNIEGRRVIVLKQTTKYHARWIFDLLHELYHVLAHLDQANSAVVETQELNPFINNDTLEEREANTFAHQVLFGDRAEDILNHCVKLTKGRMENLKSAVTNISRSENIREDILANYVAFRLSLSDQNWWGPAASFQITEPDPFAIATEILNKNVATEGLNQMENSLLKIAISNN
jgi:IrrE N-terminal-like domain